MAEQLKRRRRGGNRSTRRKPLATSFRKCHILQHEDSSPKRDSNPRNSIGGRLESRHANRYTTRHPVAINGSSCCGFPCIHVPCLNFNKKCTFLWDNCKGETILCHWLLPQKTTTTTTKLALPDICYYLSHVRCLIQGLHSQKRVKEIIHYDCNTQVQNSKPARLTHAHTSFLFVTILSSPSPLPLPLYLTPYVSVNNKSINLIHIAQFDTNGILTSLYIVITYIQLQHVHVWTYMKQSYPYIYTCLHINTYAVTCTNIYLPTY